MKTLILFLILMLNFLILSFSHPLIITFSMIIFTLFMTLIIGMMNYSFWISYIMFLIFIGGMLILFIYISSLNSNKIYLILKINYLTMFFFVISIFLIMTPSFLTVNLENQNWMTFLNNFNSENSFWISNFYNNNEMYLTIILMLFLILALIVSTKISSTIYGPMRIKF